MNNTIEFTRVRDVKMPNRANPTDVGTDFYVPNYTPEFAHDLLEKNEKNHLEYQTAFDEDGKYLLEITIPAGEQILIPSGIKTNILDKTTYLDAQNKSGIASKYHLVVGAKIIDPDYQGEIHINMLNVGNTPTTITTGMKITQFIHKQFINTDWKELTPDEYNQLATTSRGAGGFGSTTIK